MDVLKYNSKHEVDVLEAISLDPNWDMFTNDDSIDTYRKSLGNSITYVCYTNNEFCGYVRALLDDGFAVYVSELYVLPKWRNFNVGQALLERINIDFSSLTVFVLSDEDAYYRKKGYRRIGSVFELHCLDNQ